LLVSVTMFPKTTSAKWCILVLGTKRLSHGWGTSHKPFERNLTSEICTLSRKSTYVTSVRKSVDGIWFKWDKCFSTSCKKVREILELIFICFFGMCFSKIVKLKTFGPSPDSPQGFLPDCSIWPILGRREFFHLTWTC